MPQRPYIIGNWKMNGTRAMLAEARAIDRAAARYPDVQVGIAPPFTLVQAIAVEAHAIGVGGQDCHTEAKGAHTGDVAAAMLADAGANFVIVGHSERRRDHGETDALVRAKGMAALMAGMGVVICVGENLDQRDAGQAEAVVRAQLTAALPDVALVSEAGSARLAIAYEPVWAIGTGRVAAVSEVVAMHGALRATLELWNAELGAKARILYGGSVNSENARELLAADGVGGALVGGASLTAESFLAILAAAHSVCEG